MFTNWRRQVVRLDKTVDQSHVRSINQRVILNRIADSDAVSRAELARALHISKSAMTENIAALLDIGIVEESGRGASMSSGGRRPIMLKFNKDFRFIIAIDLNFEDAVFVLMNIGGDIRNRFTINISQDTSFDARLDLIKNAINMLISAQGMEREKLAVIALSAPGVYNKQTGEYRANVQFANWRMADLSDILGREYTTEVIIVNDVNAAALGELRQGAGQQKQHALYVSCGLGLGAGLILNGNLYTGADGSAGEVANFLLEEGGKVGYLESHINVDALKNAIERRAPKATLDAMEKRKGRIRFRSIVKAAQNDAIVQECIEAIANLLGVAISNIVSLLNVDIVIIGGAYLAFQDILLPVVGRIIEKYAFSPVPAVASALGQDAGITGLFLLAREEVLAQICGANTRALPEGD